jgi:hypothetical protein
MEIELEMLGTKAFGWLRQRADQCVVCVLLGAAALRPTAELTHAALRRQRIHGESVSAFSAWLS